jgi:hypothetical protein
MTRKIKYFIIAFIFILSVDAQAQNSQVMYYMRIPQNHLMNPAIKPANRFYLGLPVITGINAGFGNSFLDLKKIFPNDTIGSWPPANFDVNQLAGMLQEKNTISADANIQLFGLGFMIGHDLNIFIDVIDRVEVKSVFPKDILKLYIAGGSQYSDQTIDLSGLNIRAQYFREAGIGFSKNVTQKLRIGGKAKLLLGVASINFDNRSLSLKVNSDYSQTISADASLDISGKQRINELKNSFSGGKIGQIARDYLNTSLTNKGFGMDLGIVYNPIKMFTFSAAVTDLGYINWKDDLKSYVAKNTFNFQGITLEDVVNNTVSMDSLINGIVDTVKNSFIENPNPLAFKTYLPTGITIGASLNLFSVLSLGVLSQTRLYGGQINEALTLSSNLYFGRVFTASLSYTMANYSYDNIGFGLAFKAGPGQIYLIADKVPVNWSKFYVKKGATYSSMPMPSSWNMMNIQIGFNISFGKIVNKKVDKPMVVVEE